MIFEMVLGSAAVAIANARGYAWFIDVTLAPGVVIGGPSLLVRVDVTDPALRLSANGGHLTSGSGNDLRFFSAGAAGEPLTYNRVSYDPVAGRVVADVRMSTAGGVVPAMVVRFGNGSVIADDSDPTGTYAQPIDQTVSADLAYGLQVSTPAVSGQPPVLDAPHLTATLNPGGSVDFPVLAGSGGAVMNSVGFPPSGTATGIPSGIRYTAGGEPGSYTWRYTLTKQTTTDYGFLRVLVVASGGGGSGQTLLPPPAPPPPAPPPPASDLPTTGRVVSTDPSGLAAALAAALPGDQITLADGSYGAVTVSVGGTPSQPVVISAASLQGAKVNGLTIAADNVWASGLDITAGNNPVLIEGADCRLVRCRQLGFSSGPLGTAALPCLTITGADAVLQYCEFGALPATSQGRGVLVDVVGGGTGARISRCYFHDIQGDPQTELHEALVVGTYDGASLSSGAVVEFCRFENCSTGSRETESLDVRVGGVTVQFNAFVNSRRVANISGGGNTYQGNYFEGPKTGLLVRGVGVRVLGNKTVSGTGLRVADGRVSPADWANAPSPTVTQSSDQALLVGNDAHLLIVGSPTAGSAAVPATNTTVAANVGPVSLSNQSGTVQAATTSTAYPVWAQVRATDVGPAAL